MITLHLISELRMRLLRVLLLLAAIFVGLLYYATTLYHALAAPLLQWLPQGHLIATEIVSPLFVPMKLAFVLALLLVAPYFFHQLWCFIAPALYQAERRLIWPFLALSVCLFYVGILFAYYVVFPLLFHFLSTIVPQGVQLSPDISHYLDFTLKLLLAFGGLFQIPILMTACIAMQITSSSYFRKQRPYAIIAAFVIGMLLAPPDVLSQTIIALPVWGLYETGLLLAKLLEKNDKITKINAAP